MKTANAFSAHYAPPRKGVVPKPRALSILATVVLVTQVVGCTSTTMFRTIPGGAKVFVDGAYLGESPVKYGDSKIFGSTTEIRFELEGYETRHVKLRKDEEIRVSAAIGAFLVLIPGLWMMEYKDEHEYELSPYSEMVNYVEGYRAAAAQLNLGDSREHVVTTLEALEARVDPRGKREPVRYIDDRGDRVFIFYFRKRIRATEPISDEDFTPYIFKNDELVGIGWPALERENTE